MSDDVVLRFDFRQNDDSGNYPLLDELSEAEKKDLRKCIYLFLQWSREDYFFRCDADLDATDVKITSFEILYDGITYAYINDYDTGFWIEEGELIFNPVFFIRFKLSAKVNVDAFCNSMMDLSLSVLPESRKEVDDDPFYFDPDVYILPDDEVGELIEYLKEIDIFCGKIFNNLAELHEDGFIELKMPAVDFALEPKK